MVPFNFMIHHKYMVPLSEENFENEYILSAAKKTAYSKKTQRTEKERATGSIEKLMRKTNLVSIRINRTKTEFSKRKITVGSTKWTAWITTKYCTGY